MDYRGLTIGDWLLDKEEGFARRVVQVTDAAFDGCGAGVILENGMDYQECEPIPLTAELLEKNGWKKEFDKKPYMTFYHLEDEKYWLMWCISEHTLDIQRQNKTLLDQYNLCAERVVIACNYVHQLQHALRLCGIDKEIVL